MCKRRGRSPEISSDFRGKSPERKRGVAQRKKREMGKKKGLVVIKPRVRRTLSVGILISIFAKYLPGKMKIFRGNSDGYLNSLGIPSEYSEEKPRN